MTEEAVQRAEPTRPTATAYVRWNLIVLCVAIVVLATTVLVARHELAALEVRIFRAVNDLPQGLHTVVWPFMQYGTFITIPALAVVALVFRRFRLALAMLVAGVGVYLVALVVKGFVDRGRPAALITAVEERELFGADSLGYPSGHAAVAAALTVVVAAHLSIRWVIAALALGAIVLFGRMYVGAHLHSTSSGAPPSARSWAASSTWSFVRGRYRPPGEIESIEPIPPPATNDRGGRLPRWPGGSDGSTVGVDGRRGSRAR